MDINSIIYIAVGVILFLFTVKYDIHMFQLSSYRNERYFRWYLPGNIISHCKWLTAIFFVFAFICEWAAVTAAAVYMVMEIREKYKTPLVYTNRVKRLFTTSTILFAAIVATSIIALPKYAAAITGAAVMLSNFIMLFANIINTPIEKAINRGYYNEAKNIIRSHKGLIVIGVTGSFGKTSTKNYLAGILAEKYNVLVTPGNFNTLLGVIRTVREQLRPHHQVFIVEMGAKQQGDIKEICDLVHPQIGIVTAVGEMHLETFKCVENIQKTKFELIDALPADGLGIINTDSDYIRSYKGIKNNCRMLTYAVENDADLRAVDVEYSASGVSFALSTTGDRYESRLLGSGNLLNMLAAIAVAQELGVPYAKQKNAIARLQPVEHRLSMRRSGGITVLDDAYNSNPMGAKMALEVLKNFNVGEGNRRIVITPGFVEMGTRQAEANKELGRQIAACADYAIVVNATNRQAIQEGIEEGKMDSNRYYLAENLNDAHAHLGTILKISDVVLYENDLPDNFK